MHGSSPIKGWYYTKVERSTTMNNIKGINNESFEVLPTTNNYIKN